MNLHDTLTRFNISELEAMNSLQGAGVVSDLCVGVDDIAQADVERAVAYLESLRKMEQPFLISG